METNDNMLKDFFGAQKQEITDNGFTQSLMRKLPDQPDRGWIVWVFGCIGMIITLSLAIYAGLIQDLLRYMQHVPVYYLLGAVFCFPLVTSIGIFMSRNRNYSLI